MSTEFSEDVKAVLATVDDVGLASMTERYFTVVRLKGLKATEGFGTYLEDAYRGLDACAQASATRSWKRRRRQLQLHQRPDEGL